MINYLEKKRQIGVHMKHKIIILFLSILLTFSLSGCGQTSLVDFQNDMDVFLKDITKIDTQMNTIDPDSEYAVKEMLECLDAMNNSFKLLAEIDVPDEFASIETLADEASEYMILALHYYNEAFEDPDSYNSAKGDAALQYLQRALLRKEYIAIILQGGTPEGEGVTISYEDTDTPTTPTDSNN